MDRAYYKQYFFYERNHWWFRVREKIIRDRILSLFPGKKDLKILNIGAATGKSTEFLGRFGTVTSVEYDEECCFFLREELNIQVIQASVTELPFDSEAFDFVCAFDVIEHVEEDEKAMDEIFRVCKLKGIIFLTVPAFLALWSQHDEVNHHIRRYQLFGLNQQAKMRMGEVMYSSYFNTFLFLPIFIARKWANFFRKPLIKNKRESDFVLLNYHWVNSLLYFIFSFELFLLRFIRFPFGVSAIGVYRKIQ